MDDTAAFPVWLQGGAESGWSRPPPLALLDRLHAALDRSGGAAGHAIGPVQKINRGRLYRLAGQIATDIGPDIVFIDQPTVVEWTAVLHLASLGAIADDHEGLLLVPGAA